MASEPCLQPVLRTCSGAFLVGAEARRQIELGLLYLLTGAYSLLSQACRTGALAAIDAVNADPERDVTFIPVERDPGGNVDLYGPLCAEILQDTTARHVIGCVTSWSRKEVIPVLEKHGGTLWYACPCEGFEASDHVVYTHACPIQHLLPLLSWAIPVHGNRVWLTGSNYIWGWEINRLARETVTAAGGMVLGERYLPIGSCEVDRMIAEVQDQAFRVIHRQDAVAGDPYLTGARNPVARPSLRVVSCSGRSGPRTLAERGPSSCIARMKRFRR